MATNGKKNLGREVGNKLANALQAAENNQIDFGVPAKGEIRSPFGMRFHPVLKVEKFHTGIDIAPRPKSESTPILAAEDGVVKFTGNKGGYGQTVVIQHKGGFETFYGHLKDNSITVKENQTIRQGQTLGIMGTTGRSTGIHLHFEIRHNGAVLDPAKFYPDIDMSMGKRVKPEFSRDQKRDAENLLRENNIKPNEKLEVAASLKGGTDLLPKGVDLKNVNETAKKAAIYAMSKGDEFAAITFLGESIDGRAFYLDPASGTEHGKLVNMHAGITLNFQTEKTIDRLLKITDLQHLKPEVMSAIKNNTGLSDNMKKATVSAKQVHEMFEVVRDSYTNVAERALESQIKKNPLAQKMMREEKMNSKEATQAIIATMPDTAWGVLQHAAYKKGNLNSFGKVLQSAINATLDEPNREKHLEEGAKYINYVFRVKNKKTGQIEVRHDERVEALHRVFFVSNDKLSPRMEAKLATGESFEKADKMIEGIQKRAGVKNEVKDGVFTIPENPPETQEILRRNKFDIEWDNNAMKVPMKMGDKSYTPSFAPPPASITTPPTIANPDAVVGHVPSTTPKPTSTPTKATPQAPKPKGDDFDFFNMGMG